MSQRTLIRDQLFDLLVQRGGLTRYEMAADLHQSPYVITRAIRDLRLFLGDTDTITLAARPDGYLMPWVYELVGTFAQTLSWQRNRIGDSMSRLETMRAVCQSIVNGTDGRSLEGRRARILVRGLTRIEEDIAEVDHGGPGLW